MVWDKKWYPLNLINFSCSWPGKGAPANWEQFLNCRLVRLLWSIQGKALIFFPCTQALWKLPCVKLISVILCESRVWGNGLADGSLAWSFWPSHAMDTAQMAGQDLSGKPSKREKAPCFSILVHPLVSPTMLGPTGDWFCNMASWPLGVSVQPPTSFSPDYQFWSPLATPTRQNDVKKERSFLCHSVSAFHRQSDLLFVPRSSIWEPAWWGRSFLGWSLQMIAPHTSDFSAPSSSRSSWVPLQLCIAKGGIRRGNILNL